ncbi:MAG: PaaI family thioesterase [Rhodoferax sp.]|jgi:acyl-CoA thioesterase|nr:PaaI family thioesterase [Rhodoferax sp.]
MTDTPPSYPTSRNPFADHVGFTMDPPVPGESTSRLQIAPQHLNPNGVLHGAVLYAMADTGMGAAVFPTLAEGELCATIEIKMSYFKALVRGEVVCRTVLVNRGKRVAYLESSALAGDVLLARASGTYAIFTPSRSAGG